MRWIAAAAALAAASAFAQGELYGRGQFPQFRMMSGLPGGTFGVSRDGTPTIRGAMAISTPIAYSLAHLRGEVGFMNTSSIMQLRFRPYDREGQADTDSTAQGMVGIGLPGFRATVGGMILSAIGDSVFNLHIQPDWSWRGVSIGFGAQDVFSEGGSAGEALDKKDGGLSRSLYAVASWEGPRGVYASAGVGTMRFRTAFGNVSVPLGDRARVVAEYDGFNWNFGAGAELSGFGVGTRKVLPTVWVGAIRGKYAAWSIGFSF